MSMVPLVLASQLAAQPAQTRSSDTATYASVAVRALVGEAATINQRVPPTLGAYRAMIESEVTIGRRNSAGTELFGSIEQFAGNLMWTRAGAVEQHVTGYRAQSAIPFFTGISLFKHAWVVPSLYGNRLAQMFGPDGIAFWSSDAIHPLAADRDKVYRFSGGDTVVTLRTGDREIRVVKIDVLPKRNLPSHTHVFIGEIDLDLERKHVVRMRGAIISSDDDEPRGRVRELLQPVPLQGVILVELVNREVNQQYWLPSYQRFEAQAMAPMLGDEKAVFRIVSHVHGYDITVRDSAANAGIINDALRVKPHGLTYASKDSLASFHAWHEDVGAATATASAEDFDDVGPLRWRSTGPAIITFRAERVSDLARFNRVEGVYTGTAMLARFRDAAPGLTARIAGGYAWSERTVRGHAGTQLERDAWTYALRGGRSLDLTTDFRAPFDTASLLANVFGQETDSYVDRSSAAASATRTFAGARALVRLEVGWAKDRAAVARPTDRVSAGLVFPNRGVDEGDYLRSGFALQWRPDVAAESMAPGFGATLSYVRGDGQLNFQRADLRLDTRRNAGPWTFASRLDGGMLFGAPVPQQLYEVAPIAGDRALAVRGLAVYRLRMLTAPIRISDKLWLPAPSPALAVTGQGFWLRTSSAAARAAVSRLGERFVPATDSLPGRFVPLALVPAGHPGVYVTMGIRFFGGSVALNWTRPVDHAAPWMYQLQFGQAF